MVRKIGGFHHLRGPHRGIRIRRGNPVAVTQTIEIVEGGSCDLRHGELLDRFLGRHGFASDKGRARPAVERQHSFIRWMSSHGGEEPYRNECIMMRFIDDFRPRLDLLGRGDRRGERENANQNR